MKPVIASLGICLAAMLCVTAGCTTLPPAARRELVQADLDYRAGRLAEAELAASRIIEKHPRADEVGEAFYLRALARVRRNQTDLARRDLLHAMKRSRRRDLTALASASMGLILYEQGAYAQAAPDFSASVDKPPVGLNVADWLYHLGLCRQRSGDWESARLAFSTLIGTYPADARVLKAERLAGWAFPYYTIQCGVYGNSTNAHRQIKSLRDRGLDAFAQTRVGDGGGRIAVCVGRYADFAGAQRSLPRVREHVSDAHVVP